MVTSKVVDASRMFLRGDNCAIKEITRVSIRFTKKLKETWENIFSHYQMHLCFVLLPRIEIDTKLPIVGDQKWAIWIRSFNVPMAPGKTRSVVCSARNFFQLTMPGPAWSLFWHGISQPEWYGTSIGLPPPSTILSKREMLDRFEQHTLKRSSCKSASESFQTLEKFLK